MLGLSYDDKIINLIAQEICCDSRKSKYNAYCKIRTLTDLLEGVLLFRAFNSRGINILHSGK